VREVRHRGAHRDALARGRRPDDAPAASRLRRPGVVRCRDRRVDAPAAVDARAGPGERYPVAANEAVLEQLPELRETFYKLENWIHANWSSAQRKPTDNSAEAERRRDLVLRAVAAHVATVDRIESAAQQMLSGAVPAHERDTIAWVERGERDARYEVNAAPFDVAAFLRAALFARTPSVVLTSATLAEGRSFAFFRETMGIDDAQELIAPSPFDYPQQARLYVGAARAQSQGS